MISDYTLKQGSPYEFKSVIKKGGCIYTLITMNRYK
uniref:Uncharacterized protein n=1 Tax=Arundo donax TaxID=35708 RepID=A0A0A9A4X0_ARUDO